MACREGDGRVEKPESRSRQEGGAPGSCPGRCRSGNEPGIEMHLERKCIPAGMRPGRECPDREYLRGQKCT